MWDIRTISPDDADLFRRRLARGFGQDADLEDEAARRRFDAVFEFDRTFAVFDGADIIGTGGAFSFGLTVPGGATVPMGGTTIVTVQPTHRRQGVLRQLMSRHLDEVAERQEPVAGLWASEATIYGRFGYGQATFRHVAKVDAGGLALRRPPNELSRMRLLEPEAAARVLPTIYDAARTARAGMLTRSREWWSHRWFADPESSRDGRSEKRYLVCEIDDEPAGYAVYRQRQRWEDFVADGEVDVIEVIALHPDAHHAIWSFLVNVDLFPRVSAWNLAVDDPLSAMVGDYRRVRRTVNDALWIRLLDVPAALEARRYESDGMVTISLADGFRPECGGVYRLEVADGFARCERTEGAAELSMDTEIMGHLFLGGGDARAMAAAGRLEGDPDSVTTLHRMFSTDVAPWCPEVF